MRIENEILLDYDDVLLRPSRSTLSSRKEVDLEREFTFLYSGITWKGIPIMPSNMDTSGTFEIAKEVMKFKIPTAIHKFYSLEAWEDFLSSFPKSEKENLQKYIIPTIGMKEKEKFKKLLSGPFKKNEIYPNFVLIDVANGYTQKFVDFVSHMRKEYSDITIIAGNVATREGVQSLVFAGADIVKVGIGPSKVCFDKNTIIKTKYGEKKISDISVDDLVLTHTGEYKKVTSLFKNENPSGKRVIINGVSSTEEHEYYVLNKKYADVVNDENIHEYAEWIEAKKIDKNKYFLIKKITL